MPVLEKHLSYLEKQIVMHCNTKSQAIACLIGTPAIFTHTETLSIQGKYPKLSAQAKQHKAHLLATKKIHTTLAIHGSLE